MDTLVDGVTYLVADDVADAGGLYHGDTRHLSPLSVTIADVELRQIADRWRRPTRRRRRYANAGGGVNEISDAVTSKHATVTLSRQQRVREGRLVELIDVTNHDPDDRTVSLEVGFGADFADVFETRNVRDRASRDVSTTVDERSVTYAYEYDDRDGGTTALETVVSFDAIPTTLEVGRATLEETLASQERRRVTVRVRPRGDESTVRAVPQTTGNRSSSDDDRIDPFVVGALQTGTAAYDRTLAQARRDVRALTTETSHGPVPLAGAPWFVTVFGRDALLSSYFLLPVAPGLARATVGYLAARRGTDRNERRDEAPGKILHEVRNGELAGTGAIPQTPYYGSIDATPLWITLLHETWRWTDDDALVEGLWDALEAALGWIDAAVAATGDDPFCYYRTFGNGGVVHKTWRDSANGVQYADGRPASPPLASAAVQGYVYDALGRAAELASAVRGDQGFATDLSDRAAELAAAFDDAFWRGPPDGYAAALTADGDAVDSVTSGLGHCLWTGVVPDDRAETVADRLLEPDVFSPWGLRTLASGSEGYSPVSYHGGGIWPHDNAVTALGLANYDRFEAAREIAARQFDAYSHFDGHSIPELFCGHDDGTGPVPYPSACRPQAWAAAAPFGLLRALFGLEPDGIGDPAATGSSTPLSPDAIDPLREHWR